MIILNFKKYIYFMNDWYNKKVINLKFLKRKYTIVYFRCYFLLGRRTSCVFTSWINRRCITRWWTTSYSWDEFVLLLSSCEDSFIFFDDLGVSIEMNSGEWVVCKQNEGGDIDGREIVVFEVDGVISISNCFDGIDISGLLCKLGIESIDVCEQREGNSDWVHILFLLLSNNEFIPVI